MPVVAGTQCLPDSGCVSLLGHRSIPLINQVCFSAIFASIVRYMCQLFSIRYPYLIISLELVDTSTFPVSFVWTACDPNAGLTTILLRIKLKWKKSYERSDASDRSSPDLFILSRMPL